MAERYLPVRGSITALSAHALGRCSLVSEEWRIWLTFLYLMAEVFIVKSTQRWPPNYIYSQVTLLTTESRSSLKQITREINASGNTMTPCSVLELSCMRNSAASIRKGPSSTKRVTGIPLMASDPRPSPSD